MRSLGLVVLALSVLAVTSQDYPLPPQASEDQCSFAYNNDEKRLDCYPEANASEEGCRARGCCWRQTVVGHPFCYYPENFTAFAYVNDTYIQRKYRSPFPGDASLIRIESAGIDGHLSFKVVDANKDGFVPPYPKLQMISQKRNIDLRIFEDGNLFSVKEDNWVDRFRIETSNLIVSEQLVQLSFSLNGTLYGIGEHRGRLALDDNWTKYTLWNHDDGPSENKPLYGSHPFVLAVDETGDAIGIYFHNSNAMDILVQPGPIVTFRSIGGILEFHVMHGSPADVIRQYTSLVGLPAMPPYWGLGFHLCRWGYGSASNTRAVWQRTIDAGIPFDVQWNDIDYMRNNNDFTIDDVNFADLPQLVDDIHAAGMHYVSMLDPGVSGSEAEGTYPPYSDGVDMDVFVKDQNGSIFIGHVWNPADTVYPDFFHPRAVEYWTKQLREFRDKIKYDALWIDMNEPSNFLDGTADGCPASSLENPPYLPAVAGGKLQAKTLCMTAKHVAGTHYDLHNLFAIAEADVTRQAAEAILGKRTFLISRASFSGLGRYSGHWAGDNYSDWPEMVYSVVELLSFSLYGVPFMGSDICGFGSTSERELCNRWMQLGAFYPFSRNHNSIGNPDQDPASFDDEVTASSKKALLIRYSLLPYLYTLFYEAQVNGSTVARPLFFEYPQDPVARKVDRAFLWGSGLYIAPVLEKGATSVDVYLPEGRWFDYYSSSEIKSGNITVDAPFDTIPLFLRGGNILPVQQPAQTTTQSRKQPFGFLVVPDQDGNSVGSLFWDDGESLDPVSNGKYGLLSLQANSNNFTTTVKQWTTDDVPLVDYAQVYGIQDVPLLVSVNGVETDFSYNIDSKLLIIDFPGTGVPLNKPIDVVYWLNEIPSS